jgi:hypothetical protein
VADYINNVAAADKYTEALTLGPNFDAKAVVVTVGNNPVLMQFATGKLGAWRWTDEREFFSIPQSFRVGNVVGVKFRNANPGAIARVLAVLAGDDDPDFQSGIPFTGTIDAQGNVTPISQLPRVLTSSGLAIDNVNNGAETNIWTQQIAGNTLGANDTLRLRLFGDILNNTGVNRLVTFRIKLGGTTIWASPAAGYDIVGGANRRPWELDFLLANANSLVAQVLGGHLGIGTQASTGVGIGTLPTDEGFPAGSLPSLSTSYVPLGGAVAKDSTVQQLLEVTLQNSIADPNLSSRFQYGVAEVV